MSLRADEQPLLNGDGEDGAASQGATVGIDGDGLPKDPAGHEAGASAALGLYVWLLTLSAGLSGLLFGCAIKFFLFLSSYPSLLFLFTRLRFK